MNNSIYANSTDLYEDTYIDEDATAKQVTRSNKETSEPNTSGCRCYRLAIVCLLVLVVLMLAAIAILWVMLTTEKDQIQTSYNNMTTQRDQLETTYNNLASEKEQLDISYKTVSEERDQCQNKTDELQKTTVEFQKKFSQLVKDINTPGWKYFSSSIYFISTVKKSWSESRRDCIERGSNLVIINSREEQDFVEVWRRDEGAWIGANVSDSERVWKWVDNTAVTNGFWRRGKPSNKGHGYCAVSGYWSEPVPNWVDVFCSYEYIWICEKKISS